METSDPNIHVKELSYTIPCKRGTMRTHWKLKEVWLGSSWNRSSEVWNPVRYRVQHSSNNDNEKIRESSQSHSHTVTQLHTHTHIYIYINECNESQFRKFFNSSWHKIRGRLETSISRLPAALPDIAHGVGQQLLPSSSQAPGPGPFLTFSSLLSPPSPST